MGEIQTYTVEITKSEVECLVRLRDALMAEAGIDKVQSILDKAAAIDGERDTYTVQELAHTLVDSPGVTGPPGHEL